MARSVSSKPEEPDQPAPLIPAATVILLRDSPAGLQALILRRNRALKAFGGAWVFPGGRVDGSDNPGGTELERARAAAIRETYEEAGLDISGEILSPLSQWIPPVEEKRRFSTWFFVARAPDRPVRIDEGEIHDYQWIAPSEVMRRTPDPALSVMPPTFISLFELTPFDTATQAFETLAKREPERFETKFKPTAEGYIALWPGDVDYGAADIQKETGPYRRLVASRENWTYLRTPN